MAAMEPRLRVIFLHGYGQCASGIKELASPVRRTLSKRFRNAVFEHLDGTISVSPREGVPPEQSRGWYGLVPGDDGRMTNPGLENSLDFLAQQIRERAIDGDVLGLFGFSQGGALSGAVMAMAEGGDPRFSGVNFTVIVGGLKPQAESVREKLFTPVSEDKPMFHTPSLHVFGEADAVVSPEESLALARLCAGARVEKHPGGHVWPRNGPFLRMYRDWIEERFNAELAGRASASPNDEEASAVEPLGHPPNAEQKDV